MTSTVWGAFVRFFVECPFIWICLIFSSWLDWGSIGVDMDFDFLAEVMFVRCLHCEVILLSPRFPYWILWKEVTLPSPWLRSRDLCSPSLRMGYVRKLFGILHGRFVSSSFVYLLNHLFISIWTHGCLFSTLGLVHGTVLILLLELFKGWPSETLSVGSCVPWVYPSNFFGALLYLWALQNALGSYCTFPTSVPESTISLRDTGSFYCRMVLESKIECWWVFLAIRVSLFLGSLS